VKGLINQYISFFISFPETFQTDIQIHFYKFVYLLKMLFLEFLGEKLMGQKRLISNFLGFILFFVSCFMFYLPFLQGHYKYEVAICAIFRDEAPYLKEWIEFHKLVGVTHFYLYNNLSNDNYKKVLAPYLKKGLVEIIDWPFESTDQTVWGPIQCSAYVDGVKRAEGKVKWLAIIDIDEYCFPSKNKKLQDVLKNFEAYGGVVVHWQLYGTSSIKKISREKTLIESLTLRADSDYGENQHIKSIVRPERVVCDWTTGWTPHNVIYKKGYFAVNTNFLPVPGFHFSPVTIDKLRINHYWTRDEDFFYRFKIGRRGKWLDSPEGLIEKIKNFNQVEDYTILRYTPALRLKLGLQ
jgi:hypothetical protein